MIEIKNKSECCGCGACKNICPIGAISLEKDEEGFLYPKTDSGKCVKCGRCVKVCPIKNRMDYGKNTYAQKAYAAQTTDKEVLKKSSSGGVFTEIASEIIASGGVVFGAAMDDDLCLRHIGAESAADLDKLCGSKYVQSEIGTAYEDIRNFLDSGRKVLFCGTPCQVGGLYNFLGKSYDNLYTQDIICHGVPSPMVFEEYVKYREKKAGSKAQKIYFRNKKYGWKNFSLNFLFENGREYIKPASDDYYLCSFLSDLCLRPSCHDCAFKSQKRQSDITLADFWGVERIYPQINDNRGTSLVLVNSQKGSELFDGIKDRLKLCDADPKEAVKYNPAMLSSSKRNEKRDEFLRIVREKGFSGAEKFVKKPISVKLKKFIKRMMLK